MRKLLENRNDELVIKEPHHKLKFELAVESQFHLHKVELVTNRLVIF